MGSWSAESLVKQAIEDVRGVLWEEITYNGTVIEAKVWRTPQSQSQDNISNFQYTIQVQTADVPNPVYNCPVIFTEPSGAVECFSGQVQDATTTLTWNIDCPRKG